MPVTLCLPRTASDKEVLRQIYVEAFPIEEQRPWEDIVGGHNGELLLEGIYCNGLPVGLVTSWRLPDCYYIEHLAIEPSHRGGGIGSEIVAALIKRAEAAGVPLLLEVEPADASEQAARRIAFYERMGLKVIGRDYIQPAYQPHLPSVPMWLMASAPIDPARATTLLHRKVYNK